MIRLPGGTAHALSGGSFAIPVMGKTGTTSEFRDALFVGSTYGPQGITVAVRIGFDDNRTLGPRETGGRAALPVFRDIMLRVYKDALVGAVPQFPREMEDRIDAYLASAGRASGGGAHRRPRGAGRGASARASLGPTDRDRTIDGGPAPTKPTGESKARPGTAAASSLGGQSRGEGKP